MREGEIPAAASRSEPTPPTPTEDPARTMPMTPQQGSEVPLPTESQEERELRNANYWNKQLDEDKQKSVMSGNGQTSPSSAKKRLSLAENSRTRKAIFQKPSH